MKLFPILWIPWVPLVPAALASSSPSVTLPHSRWMALIVIRRSSLQHDNKPSPGGNKLAKLYHTVPCLALEGWRMPRCQSKNKYTVSGYFVVNFSKHQLDILCLSLVCAPSTLNYKLISTWLNSILITLLYYPVVNTLFISTRGPLRSHWGDKCTTITLQNTMNFLVAFFPARSVHLVTLTHSDKQDNVNNNRLAILEAA